MKGGLSNITHIRHSMEFFRVTIVRERPDDKDASGQLDRTTSKHTEGHKLLFDMLKLKRHNFVALQRYGRFLMPRFYNLHTPEPLLVSTDENSKTLTLFYISSLHKIGNVESAKYTYITIQQIYKGSQEQSNQYSSHN